MKISSKSWKSYVDRLSKIDQIAAGKVSEWYRNHPDADIEELINVTYYYCDHYGDAAGALACEMYDEMAMASGKTIPPAEPAKTAAYGEIASALQGTLLRTIDPDAIGAVAGRKVKMVGLDTLLNNSLRDGAEFAWIPSGDTCAFCIMLASNGWQKASKRALRNGHAPHVHSNCDCTYAIRFDENTEVEGYDPDYYKSLYDNAEGDNWRDKVNSMRRNYYAANKDRVTAQKRAAYARRTGSEENISKNHIDTGSANSYNKSPDDELRKRYERGVKEGWISPLCGLTNYKRLYYAIENQIVGQVFQGGIIIKGQSEHFLTRVIGTALNPSRVENGIYYITGINPQGFRSNSRSGVSLEDIIYALQKGMAEPPKNRNGARSQRFIGDTCVVTVNPDTGILIQCNPKYK